MIEDSKPNCKIILPRGGSAALARRFGTRPSTVSLYLSGYNTPRARQVRLYALNEMGGRYLLAVSPDELAAAEEAASAAMG